MCRNCKRSTTKQHKCGEIKLSYTLTELYQKYGEIINIFDKFPTISDQICHAHSELSEAYHCFQKPEKHPDLQMNFTDEICDAILSCIALIIKGEIPVEKFNDRMEIAIQKNLKWARTARHNSPSVVTKQ